MDVSFHPIHKAITLETMNRVPGEYRVRCGNELEYSYRDASSRVFRIHGDYGIRYE